tara:strand:- start:31 stop:879 length:849 start_codon:yes stop_codon:yes gene_type:complete
MNLIKYPKADPSHHALRKYNKLFDAGKLGQSGTVGMALDVWRDGEHLFASYEPKQGESLEFWARRNYPALENPNYTQIPMGLKYGASAPDRFQIPTRAATTDYFTYGQVEMIIKAALATAQLPHGPEALSIVPTANTLRQRMFNAEQDWVVLQVHDISNRISLRAVIVKQSEAREQEPVAAYETMMVPREQSKLKSKLEPATRCFEAPDADLSNAADRRPVIKAAKAALGLVGEHMAARSTDGQDLVEFAMTAKPFSLWIRAVTRPEPVSEYDAAAPEGFDL